MSKAKETSNVTVSKIEKAQNGNITNNYCNEICRGVCKQLQKVVEAQQQIILKLISPKDLTK